MGYLENNLHGLHGFVGVEEICGKPREEKCIDCMGILEEFGICRLEKPFVTKALIVGKSTL